jgi:hypothetical protein
MRAGYVSTADDLALHGVRVLGFATTARVAARYGLDVDAVEGPLRRFAAQGWVDHLGFGGSSGWSLTDSGKTENERRAAAELDRAGARERVVEAHARFLPLNRRFGEACTNWQIRPTRADPMAFNDHTDWRWDDRVLRTLAHVDGSFREVCGRLSARLARFDRYADLYSDARRRADAGQRAWVDGFDRDSCHIVWMQFHEDLLATLGIARGTDT